MSALAAKKKEAFAQAVAAGATFVDAYKQTRDCSKMQPSTIRSNGKKLAREPAVVARIAVLRESKEGEFPRGIVRAGASICVVNKSADIHCEDYRSMAPC